MNQPKLWRDLEPGEDAQPKQYGDVLRYTPNGTPFWQRPYTPKPIPPVQGWISLAECKPTEADADEMGYVVGRRQNGALYFCDWDHMPDYVAGFTWLPLPKLAKPDPDTAAFEAALHSIFPPLMGEVNISDTRLAKATRAYAEAVWQAALDYRDGKP